MLGSLAVVEGWLAAVNDSDRPRALALGAPDIEIVGPRGSGHGHALLADWLSRAGFASEVVHWFCGADGHVVVEQDATWTAPNAAPTRARVAPAFRVRDGLLARFQRFDTLEAALAATGLTVTSEVRARAGSPVVS